MKEEKGAPLYLAVHGLLTIADTIVPDGTLLLLLWLKSYRHLPAAIFLGRPNYRLNVPVLARAWPMLFRVWH
jgi:hypothetical protein